MSDLVTLAEVKAHLYIQAADTTHDTDLTLKVSIASDIVFEHLKLTDYSDDWYSDDSPPILTIPPRVKGTALLIAGELYENRDAESDPKSARIKSILVGLRMPSLA